MPDIVPATRPVPTAPLPLTTGYIVEGLIHPGQACAMVGRSGVGSSTLAIHLAYSIALGQPWMGLRTHTTRALYLHVEGTQSCRARLAAMRQRYGRTDHMAMSTLDCGALHDPAGRNAVLKIVIDFKPGLVILDGLAVAFLGYAENHSEGMAEVLDFVRRLKAAGIATLLLHHPGKHNRASLRGHGSLASMLDMIMFLEADVLLDPDTAIRGRLLKNRGDPAWRFAWRKDVVTLGIDSDGDPVTTTLPLQVDAGRPTLN